MVMATIISDTGDAENFRKPCFGFLGYIDEWNIVRRSDNGGWDTVSHFDSDRIEKMVWNPDWDEHDEEKNKLFRESLHEIQKAFPQYFGEFTISSNGDEIVVPLKNKNMQTTVMACMMLRNFTYYSSTRQVFETLVNDFGVPVPEAFVISMIYSGNYNMGEGGMMYYWGTGGDEQIFGDDVAIIDLKNMLEGRLGTIWQGDFGDTAQGYGREGCYDGETAAESPRTGEYLSMVDTTLVEVGHYTEEEISNSKTISAINSSVNSTHRFDSTEFREVVDDILKRLKD